MAYILTIPSFFSFGRDYLARFLASCKEVRLDSRLSFETDRSSRVRSDWRYLSLGLCLGGDFGGGICLTGKCFYNGFWVDYSY